MIPQYAAMGETPVSARGKMQSLDWWIRAKHESLMTGGRGKGLPFALLCIVKREDRNSQADKVEVSQDVVPGHRDEG
jgi:hypothetical protein